MRLLRPFTVYGGKPRPNTFRRAMCVRDQRLESQDNKVEVVGKNGSSLLSPSRFSMHPRKPNEKGSGRLEKKELLLFSAQPRAPRRGPSLRRVLRVTQIPPPRPMFQAPTSPGVYWRGDVRWIKYPPAVGARILERHETQNTGFVNIGPVRTSRGDYMVDLTHNCPLHTSDAADEATW